MKLIGAFLRLIRWQNLVFIALTQLLFYYCIYQPLIKGNNIPHLIWIIMASVFIAAAGYIINDYFDLNIDQINKPQKNVFVRIIARRWAIVWHLILSFLGIIATVFAVGWHKWYIIAANIFCIALLWFYSTSFKRKLLIGNIVISLLTAWTILIIFFSFTNPRNALMSVDPEVHKLFRLAFLYAGFAFIISLIREAIKDMEDLQGDERYNCKTLPIVAGIRTTRIYINVWLVVLTGSLIVLQLYILQFGWWPAVIYSIFLVIVPLAVIFFKLSKAVSAKDFSDLSKWAKFVMLTGILSMIFFRIYF
ncbi:MAG TPA: geranylgeranylglycerol-phosphate geranylgeranyltransferase [Flavisolibacter sp.]|nr:geranylgeranylglycerol-phosphate geranylgeranyltransferase [Flavisolibacter sp.]